jgi:hypothetical protein
MRSAAFRQAWEAHDSTAMEAALAPDVVLHSPILSAPFEGRDAVSELMAVVQEVVEDSRYTHHFTDGDADVLIARGRIGKQELQDVVLLQFGEDGLIRDITVFFRPMAALAAFASAAGPRLAKTPARARLLRAGSSVLPAVVAMTDSVALRNVRLR